MRQSKIEAGIKANRDALLVAVITPGLNEKFTGPIMPRNPERMLAKPVNATPRFIRRDMPAGLSNSCIDWIDPRSLIERAKKQNRNETRTPESKDHLVVRSVRNSPVILSLNIVPKFKEKGKIT